MKKIFTFHGEDKACGSAWLSRRTAEIIAEKRRDLKILLVHASHSDTATGRSDTSMERIRPYLTGRKALPEGIAERSKCAGDLYVITGAGPSERSGVFPPDITETFLKNAAEEYDLIICDSGSELAQGLSLGALFASDSIYTVLLPEEESFLRFEWLRPLYRKLGLKINGYVLDRFPRDGSYTEEGVSLRLGVSPDKVFMIPREASRRDLERIADDILKDAFEASERMAV